MSIINMTLSASLMIIMIELLRRLTIDKLPKKLFLALWTVTVLRLVVPFSLPFRYSAQSGIFRLITAATGHNFSALEGGGGSGPFSAVNASDHAAAAIGADASASAGAAGTAGAGSDIAAGAAGTLDAGAGEIITGGYIHYTLILFCIWLVGLMAAVLYFSVRYIRSVRKFRESVPADDALAKQLASEMHIRRRITVRESDYIRSPLAYKLFRPVILIPKNMSDMLSEEQMTYIYTHELVHIRRFDIVVKFLCTAAVCLHWFNPLVWILYLLLDRDMELACDETAIRILGSSSRSDYAMTLVRFAEFRGSSTVYSSFSKNALTERVSAVMKKSSSSPFAVTSAFVLFLAVVLAFGTSASLSPRTDSELDTVTGAAGALSDGMAQDPFDMDWLTALSDHVSEGAVSDEREAGQKSEDRGAATGRNDTSANAPNRVSNTGVQSNNAGGTQPVSGTQAENGTSVSSASPGNLYVYNPNGDNLYLGDSGSGSENEGGTVSGGSSASPGNLKTYD